MKILIEGCQKCAITLDRITLQTATIEIWRCEDTDLHIGCYVGTLQADLCVALRVSYAEASHLGSLVQAGMKDLLIKFLDGGFDDLRSGVEALRVEHPDDTINDDTDQYITRIVDGALLTERIVRLHNDFPTTLREKKAFDAEAAAKSAAMEKLASDLLFKEKDALSEQDRQRLEALRLEAASTSESASDDTSDAARAEFKKSQGSASFKEGDFQQAAVFYTESLMLDDKNHLVLSNRGDVVCMRASNFVRICARNFVCMCARNVVCILQFNFLSRS